MRDGIKTIIIIGITIFILTFLLILTIKDYQLYKEGKQMCKDEGYDRVYVYKRNTIKGELKEVICIKHTTEKKIINMRDNEWIK